MKGTRFTRVTTVGAWITWVVAAVAWAEYSVTDIVDAAKRGDGHAVHKLIQVDPDQVAARDGDGYTALHWAAIRAHRAIVTELVAAGAPVDAIGADGGTPLHWACHHDHEDTVGLLLDAGAPTYGQESAAREPQALADNLQGP